MKPNYQSNIILIDEIEKKLIKKKKRKNESIRLIRQIRDPGHKTGTTQ
jgi:hypothetical protein